MPDPLQAGRAERRLGRLGLALPHLHQERAARLQVGGRLGREPLDRLEPGGPGDEGVARLEAELRGRGLEAGRRQVRRVGGDDVEAPAGDRREAVRGQPLDVQPEPLPVGAGAGERGRGPLERRHPQRRALVGEGEGDRAAAGAPVEDGRSGRRGVQGPLHQQLGLGPGDEHLGAHLHPQAPERPLARDVGERLAPAPARDEVAGAVELGRRERPLGAGVEREPLDPEGVSEQQVRVEAGRRRAALGEEGGAAALHLAHGEELGGAGQRRARARMNEVSGPSRKA